MFWHPDPFAERLERLVDECPSLEMDVVFAYVGGRALSPGLERFYALQGTLQNKLKAEERLSYVDVTTRGDPPRIHDA